MESFLSYPIRRSKKFGFNLSAPVEQCDSGVAHFRERDVPDDAGCDATEDSQDGHERAAIQDTGCETHVLIDGCICNRVSPGLRIESLGQPVKRHKDPVQGKERDEDESDCLCRGGLRHLNWNERPQFVKHQTVENHGSHCRTNQNETSQYAQ